jgi:hypothetical protein
MLGLPNVVGSNLAIFHNAAGAGGSKYYYIGCGKVSTTAAGSTVIQLSTGIYWMDWQKLTIPAGGIYGINLVVSAPGSTVVMDAAFKEIECLGSATNIVRLNNASATANLTIAKHVGTSTSGGILVTAGTLRLSDSRIDTSANVTGSACPLSGAASQTIYLKNVHLQSGTVASIVNTTGSGTLTIVSLGGVSMNVAPGANVTITGPYTVGVDVKQLGAASATSLSVPTITSTTSLTGGAGNMTILSGTGANRTMILRTTQGGGTAQTNLTLNADLSSLFGGTARMPSLALIDNAGVGSFRTELAIAEVLTADRTLTLATSDGSRVVTIGGNVTFGGTFTTNSTVSFGTAFATSGNTLVTNAITYTLPGVTASLAPLVSPSFTTPVLGAATGTSLTGVGSGLTLNGGATNQNITIQGGGTTGQAFLQSGSGSTGARITAKTDVALATSGFGSGATIARYDGSYLVTFDFATISGPTVFAIDATGVLGGLTKRWIDLFLSGSVKWTDGAGALDLNISRNAAGIAQIGTTASNASGSLLLTNLTASGTLGVTGASTLTGLLTVNGGITFGDAQNIAVNATTGTKIGTATTQKLGFYNATPVVQGSSVADASGGAIIDAEARTAINALISRIEALGLIATV